ncbi:MAG TPA: energy transducer TonB [Opitutaceae bacterium]|nr:energy transducer TonB [Opitutaceae bacterium]
MRLPPLYLVAGLALGTPRAPAQHFLAVEEDGKPIVVVAAHGTEPMVLVGGKPQIARGNRFMLGDGGEYLPCEVAVRNIDVKTSSALLNGLDEINREFHFRCDLETGFPLANVFLVILLRFDTGEKALFLDEVGQLAPRKPHSISVTVPMWVNSNPGRYELYLFSGGRELFHTQMAPGSMDIALNRMVRERIKDVENAPVRPFVGPAPEYPKALYKKGVDGSATVAFTIGPNGAVFNPSVSEASRPEFGEAAMAVIRQWRFLPEVKGGVPVSTKAMMPFEFTAPK